MTGTALSHGTLLGGRVSYAQPANGYRTGLEPVLLAACVPARPGERVVEAGTGAGAGLLSLAARVARLRGTGIERDPAMAALARANLSANGHDGMEVLTQDVLTWRPDGPYHHAMANPPWHDAEGTPSPHPDRRAAKLADDALLAGWTAALARGLARRGTLTLVLPAGLLARGMSALAAASCGEVAVQPLWPQAGRPAKIVILRGVRLGGGPSRMLPGLTLHRDVDGYTDEAEALLRDGAGWVF